MHKPLNVTDQPSCAANTEQPNRQTMMANPPNLAPSTANVFNSVVAFFAQLSGFDQQPPPNGDLGLLRIACVGNPERTIQGELFAYLKSCYRNVVLEYRLHSFRQAAGDGWKNGRSADIMVLDDDFAPQCAVELKHYGRIQGDLRPLLNSLKQDHEKYRGVNVPLIHVGAYTDLDTLPSRPREDFEAFRFISCYAYDRNNVQRTLKRGCDATQEQGYGSLEQWAIEHCSVYAHEFQGAAEGFESTKGDVIKGRVHYFVGLANHARASNSEPGRRVETCGQFDHQSAQPSGSALRLDDKHVAGSNRYNVTATATSGDDASTRPFNGQLPRPWMTDLTDPLSARVFIVGRNPASTYDASALSHERHLDALFNRNRQSCRSLYEEIAGAPSFTRRNLDNLRVLLREAGVTGVLETNVIAYSSPMSADLPKSEHQGGRNAGRALFRLLLESVRPRVVIAHGAGTIDDLGDMIGVRLPPACQQPGSPTSLEVDGTRLILLPSLAPPAWQKWQRWAAPHLEEAARITAAALGVPSKLIRPSHPATQP